MSGARNGSGWRHARNHYLWAMVALSVLDLSPVTTATPPSAALRNSLDLARLIDRLGYTRLWLAEHHNLANIASSAPDIMIGQVAAITKNIRVGSGGVMLPNHAPLMVMERFKVLEALFPGRIDLGLGRAPGTDQITSLALRRRQNTDGEQDDFLDRFQEMLLFESKGFPASHPFAKVAAMPTDVALPPIWLLGSSGYSAELAAHVGAGFSFAHHFSDFPPDVPMLNYRSAVQAVGMAADAVRHSRGRGDLRRDGGRGRQAGDERGPAFRAPRARRIRPARLARGGRRLSVHADRPGAHRAEPQAPDCGLAGSSARTHRGARRIHQGRRGDDHHDGVRPRGAQTILRAAGGSLRAAARQWRRSSAMLRCPAKQPRSMAHEPAAILRAAFARFGGHLRMRRRAFTNR